MFTSSLTEEVRVLEAQVEAVEAKVDDPIISAKIRQFVYAPREIQDMYKADAGICTPFFICRECSNVSGSRGTHEPFGCCTSSPG